MHSVSDEFIKTFRADLHCHSLCSDGSINPKGLIDLALERGLQGLSITDHDTCEAYETAIPYAKEKGILLGAGIEFSCTQKKKSVHILAYDFSLKNPDFLEYCKRQQEKRAVRNAEILEKLHRLSIVVDESDLMRYNPGVTTLGRPHIAMVMVNKGYVRTMQEAFGLYLGDQKCCFVPGSSFPIHEAVSIIHRAGGKAFLAHPHLYEDGAFIKELFLHNFDGVECYYGRAPLYKQERWLKVAKEKGLLISGGSDFHGATKPQIELGCSFVQWDVFSSIFTNLLL